MMSSSSYLTFVALLASLTNAAPSADGSGSPLPVVDLGYVRQQAVGFNASGNYYNFSNIAYAQPPLNDLRWAAPQSPKYIPGVQNGGSAPTICPQGFPQWEANELFQAPSVGPFSFESEDCLYLDVMVPKPVFDCRGSSGWGGWGNQTKGAPVLVWIYGGGFVQGSKTGTDGLAQSSAGLIARSIETTGSGGVIFVAMNYRVGNFGALGGDKFRSQGGTPNLALLDQRFALEWVQQNIAKFGGDPAHVTVVGESGGAGAIAHHITAADSSGKPIPPPFHQAVLQSPAEAAVHETKVADGFYNAWLNRLNVSSLAEARKLDTAVLQQANYDLIFEQPAGQFPYSFTNDGSYVRETARKAVTEGRFVGNSLRIMTSYNLNEGAIFSIAANVTTNDEFVSWVNDWLVDASNATINYVINNVYPPPSANTTWKDQSSRADTFIADLLFDCNHVAFQTAFNNSGYSYKFSVRDNNFPVVGYHTEDIDYTFYNGPSFFVSNDTIAVDLQTYLVNYAVHGNPNGGTRKDLPQMPIYTGQYLQLNLTDDGYHLVTDSEQTSRCQFWATH